MKKKVVIDSGFQTGNNHDKFNYLLNTSLTNIQSIELIYASIPNSMYVFQTGINDTITFNEGGGNLTSLIAAGNYSDTNLALELTQKMTATSLASGLGLTYTVTNSDVSVNNSTHRFRFSCTGAFSIIASANQFPLEQIGFTSGTFVSSLVGAENLIFSSTQYNLLPPPYLYLTIKNFSDEIVTANSHCNGQFLLPLQGESYQLANFQKNMFFISKLNVFSQGLNEFSIELLNPDGRNPGLKIRWMAIFEITCN